MTVYEHIKTLSINEMAKAIMRLSAECSDCEGGCIEGLNDCFKCTRSRLNDDLKTTYDQIADKGKDGIADMLIDFQENGGCVYDGVDPGKCIKNCRNCIMEWLEMEAEE